MFLFFEILKQSSLTQILNKNTNYAVLCKPVSFKTYVISVFKSYRNVFETHFWFLVFCSVHIKKFYSFSTK